MQRDDVVAAMMVIDGDDDKIGDDARVGQAMIVGPRVGAAILSCVDEKKERVKKTENQQLCPKRDGWLTANLE